MHTAEILASFAEALAWLGVVAVLLFALPLLGAMWRRTR